MLQAWKPNLGSTQGVLGVWALKSSQGMLYVGGDFTLVNGKQQARFAMFPQYGQLRTWVSGRQTLHEGSVTAAGSASRLPSCGAGRG